MKKSIALALLAGSLMVAGSALAAGDNPPPPPPDDMAGPPPDGMMGGPMHGHGDHGWGHGPGGGHMFDELDTNKDGKVTKAEAEAAEQKHFDELSGGSASISKEQFVDAHIAKMKETIGGMFDRIDSNKDGKLSETEFAARGDGMFDRMDKNHDGVITKDELRGPHWGHRGPPPMGGDEKPGN